jgi:hypothetical protein
MAAVRLDASSESRQTGEVAIVVGTKLTGKANAAVLNRGGTRHC